MPNDELILKMLENLDRKVDRIQEVQTEQGIVQAENTLILKQHERRSTKLEEWVSKIHSAYIELERQAKDLAGKIKGIEDNNLIVTKHVNRINKYLSPILSVPSILKFVLLVILFVSSVFGVFKFFYKG